MAPIACLGPTRSLRAAYGLTPFLYLPHVISPAALNAKCGDACEDKCRRHLRTYPHMHTHTHAHPRWEDRANKGLYSL